MVSFKDGSEGLSRRHRSRILVFRSSDCRSCLDHSFVFYPAATASDLRENGTPFWARRVSLDAGLDLRPSGSHKLTTAENT